MSGLASTAALAVSSSAWLWYVARASGIVSLILLTGSVLLGVLAHVRWASERWPRFSTAMLHRNLSLLAVVFLGLHIATVVIDGFAPIRWLDVIIPFASPYRTFWLGLGTVAFDLVLALVVTSLLRARIGPRLWRGVHWLAYACWPVAVVHGLGTGTDTTTRLVLVVDAACVTAVIAALWWRLHVARPGAARTVALAATVIAPLTLAAWMSAGPLAPDWARRAGTPAALLARGAAPTTDAATASTASDAPTSPTAPPAASSALGPSFASNFSGTATRSTAADGTVTLRFDAALPDAADDRLTVTLQGTDGDRGFVVRNGSATVASVGNVTQFDGVLTEIQDGTIVVAPSERSPSARTLAVQLDQLDLNAGTVRGSVRALTSSRSGDDR